MARVHEGKSCEAPLFENFHDGGFGSRVVPIKFGGPDLAFSAEDGQEVAPVEASDVDDFHGQANDSILRGARGRPQPTGAAVLGRLVGRERAEPTRPSITEIPFRLESRDGGKIRPQPS